MPAVRVEKHNYTAEPFYQWDRNQVLEIYGLSLPSTPEVHFYNNAMDRAIVRQATMDSAGVITVSVPNGLLQKPYTITAHLCIYKGATFETQYTVKLPITPRTQPADYTLEDDGDVYSFNELGNKVEQAIAELREAESRFSSSVDALADLVGEKFIDHTVSQAGMAAEAKAVADLLKSFDTEMSGFLALLRGDELWANPDPSASYEAQTVPLDLSDYSRVKIIYAQSKSAQKWYEVVCSVKGVSYIMHSFSTSSGEINDRESSFDDTGVTFNGGRTSSICIPVKIIGYKY